MILLNGESSERNRFKCNGKCGTESEGRKADRIVRLTWTNGIGKARQEPRPTGIAFSSAARFCRHGGRVRDDTTQLMDRRHGHANQTAFRSKSQ